MISVSLHSIMLVCDRPTDSKTLVSQFSKDTFATKSKKKWIISIELATAYVLCLAVL